jgi:hypothetical protein
MHDGLLRVLLLRHGGGMQHGSVKEVDVALITITHTIGCIVLEIARRVADGLQVEVYDDSRLREEALRMGLHSDQLRGFREKAPNWFERMVSDKPDIYRKWISGIPA